MDIDAVFRGFVPLMSTDSKVVFLHHHYYSWNGHHHPPRKPKFYRPTILKHDKYLDWKHVTKMSEYPEGDYINSNLNKITLDELKNVVERYFKIEFWQEKLDDEDILSRLTPEIISKARASVKNISERDLRTHTVFCVATMQ